MNNDVEPVDSAYVLVENSEKNKKITIGEVPNQENTTTREDPHSDMRTFIVDSPSNVTVVLENINVQNTVQDLMSILQEYPLLSQYTAYHLDAVTLEKAKNKKKKNKTRKVIESRTLDLFSQVSELPNNQRLRIVIDNYNPTTGRLNVRRLRNVLKTEVPVDVESGGVDTALILPPPQQSTSGNEEVKHTEQKSPEELRLEAQKKVLDLYKKIDDSKLPVTGDLSLFYHQRKMDYQENTNVGKTTPKNDEKNGKNKNEAKEVSDGMKTVECIRSISFSDFNPPPPNRRMMGDYFYLQVETLEAKIFHITCTASGFFVNSTKYNTFDPSPLKVGKNSTYQNHALADLLKEISPSFKRYYGALLHSMENVRKSVQVNDPWHTLLKTAESENGQVSPEWNVPVSNYSSTHNRDMNRAEDHLIGMYDCISLLTFPFHIHVHMCTA